ncbi:MAG: pilus assembly protein PilM [Chloroflexota bacterium]|nr:MAG: pilus assembly protein PilM [Chloroflexota bacterium]
MSKRVATLFIRDTSINLLVMKGEQVEKWASLPLEPGLVSQGLIVEEEQVADKVKQIFKEAGANTSKVITALSGDDSLYRIITLPELPEAVFPEAVRREVKRTIPTPLEDIYYSYQQLPSPMKGESRIFLVTFPRNLADALVRTLRQAGVKPYIMDLAPLALCRVPNEPRAIIVNARLDHLDVAVITDRLPQVIRRLSLPGETESLEERLPLIAEEFNRTVAFYNSSHMENPVDATVPVFVCGDLVEEPEAWQSVVGGAGYQVSALSSPVEPPEGFNPNEFMVNIGLALKELLVEKEGANFSIVNFNALPEAYMPQRFSMVRVLLPIVTLVGIGLVVLAVILILINRTSIESLRSDVTMAETNVAQQQQAINNLDNQIGPTQSTAEALNAQLTNMERMRAIIHEDLDEIEKLAGGQVVLNNINHSRNSVDVTGTASNEDNIFRYAENLRASLDASNELRFSQVWISSISGSGSTFSFQFSLTK